MKMPDLKNTSLKDLTAEDINAIMHAVDAYPKLVDALRNIAQKDPREDSSDGFNEWGEADCFRQCQREAAIALNNIGE